MYKNDPFGKLACEFEVLSLGEEKYSDLYFDETPFNKVAVDEDTYLIVGRRGSGKTALAQYFSFQKQIANPICIEVRKPDAYQQVLSKISKRTSESRVVAVPHLRRVWEFVIWSLIADAIRHDAPEVVKARKFEKRSETVSNFVADLIEYLMGLFDDGDDGTAGAKLERIVDAEGLDVAKQAALKIAKKRPLIIAIDTLEQYDIEDEALMNALAALIEYAHDFNIEYAPQRIHLKVFVSGEVFPHLKEAVILNLSKAVRNPVYLLWRPRDLLRLIGWRFFRYLEEADLRGDKRKKIDWEDDDDVLEKIWRPHFGRSLRNAQGVEEDTWPYVLRHTQMRPRQLIFICNSIANRAIRDHSFPKLSSDHIIEGIRDAELELASEILNSFQSIYPHVEGIVSALKKLPKLFDGKELDKRASQSAAAWRDKYSPLRFKQLVSELGIIGRVTRGGSDTEYIDADFEYASTERLWLTHRDTCVVHPMFYRKLEVDINSAARVMPFTTKRGTK